MAIDSITVIIPTPVPIASTTRSKQTTLNITPPAKLKSRLTVRLESFCSMAPIKPPNPVPPTPAMVVATIKVAKTPVTIPPIYIDKLSLCTLTNIL